MIFLPSSAKPIDDSLQEFVNEIESRNPGFSVLAAHQLNYSLQQHIVELTIQEPRNFNLLEEFIIRAGIEFDPPLTGDELASVLGLDPIFVRSTIAKLQKLQTLAVSSTITVTTEGRSFYEQGTVLQPPYSIQIYGIVEPLLGIITFQSQPFSETPAKLTDSAILINIENLTTDISALEIAEIETIIRDSDLEFNRTEKGNVITSFRVLSPTSAISKQIYLFVVVDLHGDKFSIQIRIGKQVVELPSNTLKVIAKQLWLHVLKNHDYQLAIPPLCIWGALGMEELALTNIQQNSLLELLPLWLKLAIQGLRNKSLPANSASFQKAVDLLSEVTGEEAFIEPLITGLREIIAAIATDNYDAAFNLLSNEVWAQFLRLHIVQESDSPDTLLSQYTTPQNQSVKTKATKRQRKV